MKEELLEQRKELSRLRRKESYEIEKAKRQNKIKSKKYHKVMKKEKLKKKLAEFEELRKVDPEAVLAELEKIEKARIEERAHQRHRNTGTWAKNLQVRGKFDRDARQELTQQIEIGRQLKQKQNADSSDDDQAVEEDEGVDQGEKNPFNPWMKSKEAENGEANEEFSGYRKYWETRNKNDEELKKFEEEDPEDEDEDDSSQEDDSEDDQSPYRSTQILDNGFEVESVSSSPIGNTTATLDEIFETIDGDDVVSDKVSRKLISLRNSIENKKKRKGNKNSREPEDRPSRGLEFNKKARLADADEKMNESVPGETTGSTADNIKSLRKLLSTQAEEEEKQKETKQNTDELINPNKFIAVEPRRLKTALPDSWNDEDVDDAEDDEEVDLQRMTIAEAFEDDDIVMDFKQEKEDKTKSEQLEDINLTLPGWGSWTGSGISENEEKKGRRRMVLKFPKELPRKDDNKDKLILNETVPKKLKEHLVNEVPFPFRSVSDYESSIRVPVTRTFVPETVHRVLTKPSVVTKMGKIINPMDEEMLLKSDKPIGVRKLKSEHKLEDSIERRAAKAQARKAQRVKK